MHLAVMLCNVRLDSNISNKTLEKLILKDTWAQLDAITKTA